MAKSKDKLNDQLKQFADLQAKSFEPFRQFAGIAALATEQVLRKNYEVMGDWVDYTIKQAQLPVDCENVTEITTAQMEQSKEFAEKLNARSAEYAELSKELAEKLQVATNNVAASVKAA